MKIILSRFFYILKYLLFLVAFALVLFGIIMTYKRLDKSLVEGIYIFVPFLLVFIVLIVDLFIPRNKEIKNNLLLQFVSVMIFAVIIVIGIRAKFDTNMLLYYKYGIDYNPLYFSDNLPFVLILLYFLFFAYGLIIVNHLMNKRRAEKPLVLKN